MVDGSAERRTELTHIGVERGNMLAELGDTRLNFGGIFLDLEATQALKDGLQIGHKAGWTDDDNFFVAVGIFDEVALGRGGANFIDEEIVIKALGRNKHEGEFHGFFGGTNIFGGFVDTALEIVANFFGIFSALGFVLGGNHAIVVFERELGVDRENFALVEIDDRVDNLAILEFVLKIIRADWQHIAEHCIKIVFAKNTALFRVLEDGLESFELVGNRFDVLIGFVDSGETSGDFGDSTLAVAHLLARFGKLARDRILYSGIIEVNLAINRFVHEVDFVLGALVFAVDFFIERARKAVDLAHQNNNRDQKGQNNNRDQDNLPNIHIKRPELR